ncbi:MAG: hypothetical protein ACTSRG_08340 [Candidatus Helarchaeota archaeon]
MDENEKKLSFEEFVRRRIKSNQIVNFCKKITKENFELRTLLTKLKDLIENKIKV